jgi:stage II sporulation protein P
MNKTFFPVMVVLMTALVWWGTAFGTAQEIPSLPGGIDQEMMHDESLISRLIDQEGRQITMAALELALGDIYIDEQNNLFEVINIKPDGVVEVAGKGKAEMPDVSDAFPESGFTAFIRNLFGRLTGQAGQSDEVIGIYHTHSAESYIPTSGDAFKNQGDIYQVGMALKQALENEGYEVVYSDKAHLPHDSGAYLRSRRTAAELSQNRPVTLIDVHRDAIPDPDEYRVNVNGEQMTSVRIVVGKQNQNRDANLEYAKRIKAIADKMYPGLIKGIFHARGNYNQDLGPRMILLEFGTHLTSLEEAQKSANLMAKVIPAAAGIAPGTAGSAGWQIGSAAMRTFWWILGLALIAGAVWLWMNKEGLGLDKWLRRLRIGKDDHEE